MLDTVFNQEFFANLSAQDIVHYLSLLTAAGIMLAAAISDAKRLIISNRLCLMLVALFPVYILSSPHSIDWQHHVMVAGIVLMIGFAMFAVHFLGGGDVKMLAAAALWAGPKLIATLLVYTTIAGGILALIFAGSVFVKQVILKKQSQTSYPWHKTPVPYGLAIACGGVSALVMMAQMA